MSSIEDGKVSGMEAAAKSLLTQAVELDTGGRHLAALTCYTEGIAILMDIKKAVVDTSRRDNLDKRLLEYLNRAEKLKLIIEREKKAGRYRESYKIAANSIGYGYERIFRYLIDDELREVEIEDPYIRIHHQLLNLLRLTELFVGAKRSGVCPNLKSVRLLTGKEEGHQGQQQELGFEELRKSLRDHGVGLKVEYSSTLHDREIRLSNGWVVKIGRGLDYFKSSSKLTLGYCDMNLRPCHETTIDIFHRNQRTGSS